MAVVDARVDNLWVPGVRAKLGVEKLQVMVYLGIATAGLAAHDAMFFNQDDLRPVDLLQASRYRKADGAGANDGMCEISLAK